MKKLILVVFIVLLSTSIKAQFSNQLSVDLNFVRYAPTYGVQNDWYSPEFNFINGFNIGYSPNNNLSYFIGFRRVSSTKDPEGLFEEKEVSEINGMEYRLGVKYAINRNNRFYVTGGIEFFNENTQLKGFYILDYPPVYRIDHKKNYFGVAPSLELNLKITDKIILYAESRYRIGHANLKSIGKSDERYEIFPELNYWQFQFDLLNAIGLKFEL